VGFRRCRTHRDDVLLLRRELCHVPKATRPATLPFLKQERAPATTNQTPTLPRLHIFRAEPVQVRPVATGDQESAWRGPVVSQQARAHCIKPMRARNCKLG